MKYKIKLLIYVIIVVAFACVAWIKYDYDRGEKLLNADITINEFEEFIKNNNIKKINFTCPAQNNSITYLDNEYLLTDTGEIYKVDYRRLFSNGYNCEKIDIPINIKGFYNDYLVYDDNYILYDINDNFNKYTGDNYDYYVNDLKNLESIKEKYPYIYFYDVKSLKLSLDDSIYSKKLLIDNRGNINVYTNYGYASAFSLLKSEDTTIIFNKSDYVGVILAIYRCNHNQIINPYKTKYLSISEEVSDNIYGIRIITNNGMYNEVMDQSCNSDFCDTKLEQDNNFSKYF